jgi:hypothetical protein
MVRGCTHIIMMLHFESEKRQAVAKKKAAE